MIEQRAKEKDISYAAASMEVLPEYQKNIRYRDTEFEDVEIKKRQKELNELAERLKREKK